MSQDRYTPEAYRRIRIELGMTQAQLAHELGVTQTIIQMRETGKRSITREASCALRWVLIAPIDQHITSDTLEAVLR
jgi:transcriptional regulator with XRE-family HTH domain